MTEKLSDEKLFFLCKMFGARALEARRKFLGLLPEVNSRRLYAKKGFSSIFEFAAKLAGVSGEQVRNVLNIDRKFESIPVLKNLLINGEISVNKLVRVASIATPENQVDLAEKVKLLPNRALEVLVRDVKNAKTDALQEPIFTIPELHVQPANHMVEPHLQNISRDINLMKLLSEEVKAELMNLADREIDVNKIISDALRKRAEVIAEEKEKVAAVTAIVPAPAGQRESAADCASAALPARYISIKIRRILSEEFGTKCSINGCYRKSEIIHHTQRFSLARNHDPRFLAPLCKEHHAIAHAADVRFWEWRAG